MCRKLSSVTTKISGVTDTKLRCSFATTPALANHDKYYSQLGKTRTANPLYYVGPREKERFIQILLQRLREPKLEALVRNLFRPSYGGNRNFYADVFVRRVSCLFGRRHASKRVD